MSESFCLCLLKFHSNPGTSASTILELIVVLIIIGIGIIVNSRFRTKLQIEKKQTPIGRRGNVVAPIMSVFCQLQIVFWPLDLLLLWEITNEIVPVDLVHPRVCALLVMTLKSGRMCIAYHSLFVALIRYIHIVHDKTLNQWNYERAAKCFKFFSIIVPIAMELLGNLTYGSGHFTLIKEIRGCMGLSEQEETNVNLEELIPSELVRWTMTYLSAPLVKTLSYIYVIATVIVSSNIVEAYLYLRIFQKMKRYLINHTCAICKGLIFSFYG